jgi:hypothetical protein
MQRTQHVAHGNYIRQGQESTRWHITMIMKGKLLLLLPAKCSSIQTLQAFTRLEM